MLSTHKRTEKCLPNKKDQGKMQVSMLIIMKPITPLEQELVDHKWTSSFLDGLEDQQDCEIRLPQQLLYPAY